MERCCLFIKVFANFVPSVHEHRHVQPNNDQTQPNETTTKIIPTLSKTIPKTKRHTQKYDSLRSAYENKQHKRVEHIALSRKFRNTQLIQSVGRSMNVLDIHVFTHTHKFRTNRKSKNQKSSVSV